MNNITRVEKLLGAVAGEGDSGVTPKTRKEHYLSAIAGETDLPAKMQEEGPLAREEIYYQKILDNGGGGGGGEKIAVLSRLIGAGIEV